MRDPVLSRSNRRARQRRSLRFAAIGVAALVAIAVGVTLVGGSSDEGDAERPAAQVAFEATITGEGDRTPKDAAVRAEGEQIVALLDDWYQRAFVDPKLYGDGSFTEVAASFDEPARTAFQEDLAALTIGPAREEVERVEPTDATAAITVFFEKGKTPVWASARVTFAATGTMRDDAALPLQIDQEVTLFLRRGDDGWLVSTFYDAKQEQRSVQPSPGPTGSPA